MTPEDLLDLNFSLSSIDLGLIKPRSPVRRVARIAVELAKYGLMILNDLWQAIWGSHQTPNLDGKITGIFQTGNQYRALSFLQEDDRIEVYAASLRVSRNTGVPVLIRKGALASLRFLPLTIRTYFQAPGIIKQGIEGGLSEFLITPGYLLAAREVLSAARPAAIVISNDHVMRTRAFIYLAQELGIRIAYVQHASVTSAFPALNFDYAFLDGEDSLQKYKKAGIKRGKIFLSGSTMHDSFLPRPGTGARSKSQVGVALNLNDDIATASGFVHALSQAVKNTGVYNTISFRPHPRDSRDWTPLLKLVESHGFTAVMNRAPLSEFLENHQAIFASDTNLHLDAAMFDVSSAFVNLSGGEGYDHYGFVETGLVPALRTKDINAISGFLVATSEPNVSIVAERSRLVKSFIATRGTRWEFRSGQLVLPTLLDLVGAEDPSKYFSLVSECDNFSVWEIKD